MMDLANLRQLFSQAGVGFAYLFGSRARGQEGPDSDYDIAVWYVDRELDVYQRFLRGCDLQVLLAAELGGKVDLVILNDAQPVLQNETVLRGKALYPDDPEAVIRFEARVRQRYEDYSYSQRFFTEARRARMGQRDLTA